MPKQWYSSRVIEGTGRLSPCASIEEDSMSMNDPLRKVQASSIARQSQSIQVVHKGFIYLRVCGIVHEDYIAS